MLSDWLFEAKREIREYQLESPVWYDDIRDDINDIIYRIDSLRAVLDGHPHPVSTQSEKVKTIKWIESTIPSMDTPEYFTHMAEQVGISVGMTLRAKQKVFRDRLKNSPLDKQTRKDLTEVMTTQHRNHK